MKKNNLPVTLIAKHRVVYITPKENISFNIKDSAAIKMIWLQIPALQQSSSDNVSQEENAWHTQYYNLLYLGLGQVEGRWLQGQYTQAKCVLTEKLGPSKQNADKSRIESLLKQVLPVSDQEGKTILTEREPLLNYQINLAVDKPLPDNAHTCRIDDWKFVNQYFNLVSVNVPISVNIKEVKKKKKVNDEARNNNNNASEIQNNTNQSSMVGVLPASMPSTFSMQSTQVRNQTAIQFINAPRPLNSAPSFPGIPLANQAPAPTNQQNQKIDWLVIASEAGDKETYIKSLHEGVLARIKNLKMSEKHFHTLAEYFAMAKMDEDFIDGNSHAAERERLRKKFIIPENVRILYVKNDLAFEAYEALTVQLRTMVRGGNVQMEGNVQMGGNVSNVQNPIPQPLQNISNNLSNNKEVELSEITYGAFAEILTPPMMELVKLLNNYDSVKHICQKLLEDSKSNFKFYLADMSSDSLVAINDLIDNNLRTICDDLLFGQSFPGIKEYFQRYFEENIRSNALQPIEEQVKNVDNINVSQPAAESTFVKEPVKESIVEQPLVNNSNNSNNVHKELEMASPRKNQQLNSKEDVKKTPLKKRPLSVSPDQDNEDDTPLAMQQFASVLVDLSKSRPTQNKKEDVSKSSKQAKPTANSTEKEVKKGSKVNVKSVSEKTPSPSVKRKSESEGFKNKGPSEKKLKPTVPRLGKVFEDLRKLDEKKAKANEKVKNNNNNNNSEPLGMRQAAVKATMSLTKNSRKVTEVKKTALKTVGDISSTPPATPPLSPKL